MHTTTNTVSEATLTAMLKASNAELWGVLGQLRRLDSEQGLSAPLAGLLDAVEAHLDRRLTEQGS